MSEVTVEKSWKITPQGIGRRDYSQNIERYDEEPTLLLFEGFEDLPPAWLGYGSGGYSVERYTLLSFRGGACLRITTGTDPANNNAGYVQYFGMVRSQKVQVEVKVRLDLGDFFGLALNRYLGPGQPERRFDVRYDLANEKWVYILPNGTYADVPNGSQKLGPAIFHNVCLAADFEKAEYLYLQCNEKFMPLIGAKPYEPVMPYGAGALVWIYLTSGAVPGIPCYIDNVQVAEVI